MFAALMRGGLLAAGLSGVAATSPAIQDQYQRAVDALSTQPVVPAAQSSPIAPALGEWRALNQSSGYSFERYATFLLAHPGWPGETAMRKMAERAAENGGWSPSIGAAYFRRFPPLTNAGWVRFAEALEATGAHAEALNAARTGWIKGALPTADETKVLTYFAAGISPADQNVRMDALLWQGQTTAAQRQLAVLAQPDRGLFAVRLGLRTGSPDAADLAAPFLTSALVDPGFVADRAVWLRNRGDAFAVRAWLSQPHQFTTTPADPEHWLAILWANARDAAADAQWLAAFNIARQVDDAFPAGTEIAARSYAERDLYTNLTWLAGQAAIKHLGRPADAMALFTRYAGGSHGPQVQSKGLYWAARAAEAAGQAPQATALLQRAAAYHDQFYGQLATERLGLPMTPPTDPGLRTIDPTARQAFYARDTVRAAQYLGTVGERQDQTAFLRQIAADAKTDTDHLLAAELSRTLARPDLGVMVGRSALANGLPEYSLVGFPSVAVPAGYESDWTMIHAISRQESQFDRAAVSHAGARGLMQLMPGTARETASRLGLAVDTGALTSDPSLNVRLGSTYFGRLYAQYGSYPLAVAAYNAGPGNVNKWLDRNGDPRTGTVEWIDWIEAIPLTETRGYVQRVLENAVVYDLINPARARSTGNARLSWYLGNKRPG